MKCLACGRFSFKIICPQCIKHIGISPRTRIDSDGFKIYSFFEYSSVEMLLKSKYSLVGSRVYGLLSKMAADYVAKNVEIPKGEIHAIGLDDRVEQFYSHSGVIVRGFCSVFTPLYGKLVARNNVHYAGQSLEFRQQNKKGFVYSGVRGINAILLDDIITTGCSINEAREVLESCGVKVLFALVLSDARF